MNLGAEIQALNTASIIEGDVNSCEKASPSSRASMGWHCGVEQSWSIPILLGSGARSYAMVPENQNEDEK